MAENGDLPRWLAAVHPRYRTPSNAILCMTAGILGLALSGSFVVLALASGVARLVIYTGTCAAALRLRYAPTPAGPAPFVAPGGPFVPVFAIAVSLTILAGATSAQLVGGAVGLAGGAVLFLVNERLVTADRGVT
jgi:amino acid transporter